MDDDPERLNRLLDDLAAERDPRDRVELSAADVELAQTAAFLKAAHGERSTPIEEFVEQLGGQMAAASSSREQLQRADPAPAPGLSRRGLLGRLAAGVAGLVVGTGAGAAVGTHVSAEEAYERGKHDGYRQEGRERFRAPLAPADRRQVLAAGPHAGGRPPKHSSPDRSITAITSRSALARACVACGRARLRPWQCGRRPCPVLCPPTRERYHLALSRPLGRPRAHRPPLLLSAGAAPWGSVEHAVWCFSHSSQILKVHLTFG